MRLDPRDQRLHSSALHDVFGPSTHFSDDYAESWSLLADFLPPICMIKTAVVA